MKLKQWHMSSWISYSENKRSLIMLIKESISYKQYSSNPLYPDGEEIRPSPSGGSLSSANFAVHIDCLSQQSRSASLTRTVRLSNHNVDAPRRAQRGRKHTSIKKGNIFLARSRYQYEYGKRKRGQSILSEQRRVMCPSRSVRKVYVDIAGLWRHGVRSDLAS